jgi:aspartyl-tRNA(Asn)/glutamyl-tRNA(Gln) amidotransferase subunit B
MRTKEEAQDYRYFAEPDLPLLEIDEAWIDRVRGSLPELPREKLKRFQTQYGLTAYEANNLAETRTLANFFEAVARHCNNPKLASNLILRDVLGYLKEHKQELEQTKLTPQHLAELVRILDDGTINSKVAQGVFLEVMQTGEMPAAIVQEKNLKQIEDPALLAPIIERILATNQESVAKYKAGNTKLFMFFVGQAMKETQGKANPKVLQELIEKMLK